MDREKARKSREEDLLKPYLENRMPRRRELIDVVRIFDILEAMKGMDSPIYMFLDPLLTDDMCRFLKHFKLRTPTYIQEISKMTGKSVEDAARMGQELANIGILEYWPDDEGVDRLYLPQLCVGSLEWIMMNPENIKAHPEEAVLFEKHIYDLATQYGVFMPMSNHGVHRTVPIESALTNDTKHMEWEELTKLIEANAEDTYAVGNCICRQGMAITGEGDGEPSLQWCTVIGHLAKYMIRTGKARQISKEEFLEILKKSEDRGFVHNVANANGKDEIEYICNCDYKTCYTMRVDLYTQNSSLTRSNFTAQVDVDKCTACGQCVEICPMNAVKMGWRLNNKKGLKYHYKETPHEYLKWGSENYHPDYLYEREEVWSETGTAPCKTNCPAHISVQGFLCLAALGRYDEALKLIKHNNPLPAVCGSICDRRCEVTCTRRAKTEPVAISEVMKFLAQRELQKERRYIPEKIETWETGKKVAVIGSGPAGLSCAYYLQTLGEHVTVFEKNTKIGGMMQYGIPSFRLEKSIVNAEVDVIREMGAEFRTGIEVGKDITLEQLREQDYEAFYFAIGLQSCGTLGIPGADADGVMGGVDFLRHVNDGEENLLQGKVVVIGGGNIAADVARTAIRSGAKSVELYCLESYDGMPMAHGDRSLAEKEGISIHAGWEQTEILTEDGKCRSIRFRKCDSSKNSNGKNELIFDPDQTIQVECQYVLYCIGQKADWGQLLEGTSVKCRPDGTALADTFTYQTAETDIFVGGDICTGQKFCIDAIAAGKEAATSIHRYIWGGHLSAGRNRNIYCESGRETVRFESYDNGGHEIPSKNSAEPLSFSGDREVFTEEQMKSAAARCLRCGTSHVDENMCLGCAVCTTRCDFDAIHIRRIFDTEPVIREKLVPSVAKEIARRSIWKLRHKPKIKTVNVGTKIDAKVSYATDAKFCRPSDKGGR